MITINNNMEIKRPRGRPRKNTENDEPQSNKQKANKKTSSKTPSIYIVMSQMEPTEFQESLNNDLANIEQNNTPTTKYLERSKEYKIIGNSKKYQEVMQSFIEKSISNGKTKLKFEFVIK